MRLITIIRSLFLLFVLDVSLIFLTHSTLCINYVPYELEQFLENCENSVKSIAQVNLFSENRNHNQSHVNRDVQSAEPQNIIKKNREDQPDQNDKNETSESKMLNDQWHRIPWKDEVISINVKTCFDFSIKEIFSDSVPKYSGIVYPLRLTLILIVTSFLLAVLELSSRMVIHSVSLTQCVTHSVLQLLLWGSILVNMELYRRRWHENWLIISQKLTEIPTYPIEWAIFELQAFIIMLISIVDSILFKHMSKKMKIVNSQGVYKCIQSDFKM